MKAVIAFQGTKESPNGKVDCGWTSFLGQVVVMVALGVESGRKSKKGESDLGQYSHSSII
jgi:hypothetical protein